MKKLYFLLYLFPILAVAQNLPANSSNELEKIIPKTPEAGALSKFIDIPPGSYTGTTSVSVPVYTINSFVSIPLSIDYHASGITVGQISSRSGLGWVINVGNISLSKQIIGYDDVDHIPEYNVTGFNPDAIANPSDGIQPLFIFAYNDYLHSVNKPQQAVSQALEDFI